MLSSTRCASGPRWSKRWRSRSPRSRSWRRSSPRIWRGRWGSASSRSTRSCSPRWRRGRAPASSRSPGARRSMSRSPWPTSDPPRSSCSRSRATWATWVPVCGWPRRPMRRPSSPPAATTLAPDAVRGAAGLHFALPVAAVDGPPASDRPLIALDPEGDPLRPERAAAPRDPRLRRRAPRAQPRAAVPRRRPPPHPDEARRLQPQPRDLGRRRPLRLTPRRGSVSRHAKFSLLALSAHHSANVAFNDWAMPRISSFFGIVITMYFRDHNPPHFHAAYGEHSAKVAIATGGIIEGSLPGRARRLVCEWAILRRHELEANWERAKGRRPLANIDPLP